MKNNYLKAVLIVFTILLTSSVYAQGPPSGGRGQGGGRGQQRGSQPDASEIFSKLDTDNDNKISAEEASQDQRGKISQDFEEIDSNDDGFIDIDELSDSLNSRSSRKKPKKIAPKKLIKQIDDNGDETLNELEVAAKDNRQLIKDFSKIDVNQDGELDLEELEAFYANNEDDSGRKRKKKD
ncbi:hypothetical protein [Lacinutrix venerupis]|uniref:EF-hand domain-containing protein n=1 Tax=Lacinutrix venerupis TaxID=1486034 RepID=A0AAC9LJY3_9FLAO|nr:hypothetical protein [Lacinutrix venerupis]APX99808.1 hypothetical protein BWR22_05620 [Lacinutrix venerupis]